MEDYIQFSAKTKSEAITKACIELGVSSDQLEIQVISEGSNGFFGIGSKPAVIKVRKIEPVSEEEEMKEIVETVKLDSFKEEAPVQEEKKTEAIKPVKKEIKDFVAGVAATDPWLTENPPRIEWILDADC